MSDTRHVVARFDAAPEQLLTALDRLRLDLGPEGFRTVVLPTRGPEREAFLAGPGREVTVLLATAFNRVDAELIHALPALQAVLNLGVGYDSIDVAAAAAAGVHVSHTPGVLDADVADTALYLYLDTLRRFSAAARFVEQGRWERQPQPAMSTSAAGRRVGILGLGRIGTAIAERVELLGAEVHYSGRAPHPGETRPFHPSALALAEAVDDLIVVVSGGDATRHLVDAEVLAALGPEGRLVNVARGSVVDEEALVAAVQAGALGGVGLDVVAHEPHVPAALLGRDDVVVLPHVGSATEQTRQAMADLQAENLRSWIERGELVTEVPETRR